jgi:hypothetical protein
VITGSRRRISSLSMFFLLTYLLLLIMTLIRLWLCVQGLPVLRWSSMNVFWIINEPTAAAIAGLDKKVAGVGCVAK